ncbi:MAG TPA: rRNA maturation RNase YbeY [Stellaceae bacterium]|nr:rRNA maturation RNase YbeY [Stellaceae bacterium]
MKDGPINRSKDRDPIVAIDVAEPCARWRESVGAIDGVCERAARAALSAAGKTWPGEAELSIVLGDDALVRSLNHRWRAQDKPTNVLSFPAQDGRSPPDAPRLLGDVVLAFETVAAEAAAQGKPIAHHVGHLVVHGVLHLLGFDHEAAAEAERMEALETAVLAALGVPDPYRQAEAPHG